MLHLPTRIRLLARRVNFERGNFARTAPALDSGGADAALWRARAPMDAPTLAAIAQNPLDVVLEILGRSAGICVFDLDSTLLDNRPRQALILREFGAAIGEPRLAAVGPEHFDGWDLEVAMRHAGLPAARAAELREPARRFWRGRFFTSAYCRHDVPVRGSVEYVSAVRRAGAEVVYLTGRHVAMRAGTLASLRSAGFPVPERRAVHLLLKPKQDLHDDLWKERACARVAALGHVVAAFDNEPAHINRYRQTFPDAICVHLETDDSGRAIPLASGIPSVPNFLR